MHDRARAVRIGTWNTQWDKKGERPGGARGVRIAAALAEPGCHVLCVTEGAAGLLPSDGCIIDAGANWGTPPKCADHRKVLLWSRSPWAEVDCVGSPDFPGGRFVKGVTKTPIGPLTVVGVCIPWEKANAAKGRDKWEDHEAWLEAFERLPWRNTTDRMAVLGDFNQQIPRNMRRVRAARKKTLRRAFEPFVITTAGEPGVDKDHIAHTRDMKRTSRLEFWPRRHADNEFMSDHIGVWANFGLVSVI